MRIAIDARAYAWAGIGRYIRNLLHFLAAEAQSSQEYVVLISERDLAAYTGPFETIVVEWSYYSWREQTVLLHQLHGVDADLFHFTHFNMPWFFNRPYVVTIHDVTRFVFPGQKRQQLRQQIAYEALLARTVARAQRSVAVSNYTAQALQALPLSVPGAVTTIYEGVDAAYFKDPSVLNRTKVRMLLGTHQPYILYVGVWMSHKNLERLLQAYAQVRNVRPEVQLVITGQPVPGYVNIIDVARRLGIEDHVIFPGFVPETLMSALYAEASCCAFVSLYEGFGLPALEAAACGVPVVTSHVTSMPEIMEEAACYVNPESVRDIARGLLAVLQSPDFTRTLATAGQRRAREFSWERSVQAHRAVYDQCNV